MRPSEPTFPDQGVWFKIEDSDPTCRLGDKVKVSAQVIVDEDVSEELNPLQASRLVARHSKGIWSDTHTFATQQEKEDWDFIQETSLLLGCMVASRFTCRGGVDVIVFTQDPLRYKMPAGTDDNKEEEVPHTLVRLHKNLYKGDLKISDVLMD